MKRELKEWVVVENPLATFLSNKVFPDDVRLYLSGDFFDRKQKLEYAQVICDKLNSCQNT